MTAGAKNGLFVFGVKLLREQPTGVRWSMIAAWELASMTILQITAVRILVEAGADRWDVAEAIKRDRALQVGRERMP